ncbi:MAG: hypothetical protein HN922_13855 [Anaerolineae bacterium]|jgi:hypothetical protein|nr:hypothetical protein [Anaerolineae bacterium]
MSFSERISKGIELEKRIFNDLEKMGFHVAINGTEHTHPRFVKNLKNSEDQSSLTIRFQPDGVIAFGDNNKSAYIEIKSSPFIEKLAYTNYKNISDGGSIVVLVSENNGVIKFNSIKNLAFKEIKNSRFPIIDGWVSPREHEDWQRIKRNGFRGSGTPYKLINHDAMIDWSKFKELILSIS